MTGVVAYTSLDADCWSLNGSAMRDARFTTALPEAGEGRIRGRRATCLMQKTREGRVAGAPFLPHDQERTMNRMLTVVAFVLALTLAACATPRVYTDHDP